MSKERPIIFTGAMVRATLDGKKTQSARDAFADLWDSINAKRGFGWDKNPWVWVLEFERVK